jgi:hypothetical protein
MNSNGILCNFSDWNFHLFSVRFYLPRSLGIFSGASDSSMCPGVDSTSKNEYQDIPGGKDGWCIKGDDLTTFMCQVSRNSGALTYQSPKGH